MKFSHFVNLHKPILLKTIDDFFENQSVNYLKSTTAQLFLSRFHDLCRRGKLLRGLFAVWAYSLSSDIDENAYRLGLTMELIETSFLIHDDILDSDVIRRGIDSMHIQFQKLSSNNDDRDPELVGLAGGLLSGDIGFFLIFDVVHRLQIDDMKRQKILKRLSQELIYTTLGEYSDISFGLSKKQITTEEIQEMYRLKTGRYTFVLPLLLGSIASGVDEEVAKSLEVLSESYGLLFQIADDMLGFFGATDTTGKSAMSDIKEGKQTLLYTLLREELTDEKKKALEKVFGNKEATSDDIVNLVNFTKEVGIDEKMNQLLKKYRNEIVLQISNIKLTDEQKEFLLTLAVFIEERSK